VPLLHQAFYADIYIEASRAAPASSHTAIREMHKQGWLQRHYTLNIDGLSEVVGLDTWHAEQQPAGSTVELHGNIR
jgi:NAD-dependent SIR2 family protein deacetylase